MRTCPHPQMFAFPFLQEGKIRHPLFLLPSQSLLPTIVTDGADAAAAAADDETVDSAGEAHSVLASLSTRQLTSVRASIF